MSTHRVALGSIFTECNQLGGVPIDLSWFERYELHRGAAILGLKQGVVGGMLRVLSERGATPVPLLYASTCPGGPLTQDCYEQLKAELLTRLRAVLPVDGVKGDPKPFGLTVSELSPILVEKYKIGIQKGLVVKEINPASFIADVKDSLGGEALVEGDLIQRINRVSVTDLKAFNELVSKLKIGDPVVLHIITYNPRSANQETKIVQFTVR